MHIQHEGKLPVMVPTPHRSQVWISDPCLSSITDLQSSLTCVMFLMAEGRRRVLTSARSSVGTAPWCSWWIGASLPV